MTSAELQRYIHERIPITAAMGVVVTALDARQIALEAPLDRNINHRGTVFGGSLNSLAVVCAWSAIFVFLRRRNIEAEVVVRHSEMCFQRPATGAFAASAAIPADRAASRALLALQRKSMGRFCVDVAVSSGGNTCATLAGEFAVLKPPHAG